VKNSTGAPDTELPSDKDRPQVISDIAASIIAKPVRKTGRPPKYSREIAREFCRRIALGRSLRSVCEDEDMPDSSTAYRWKDMYTEFREMYASATEERGLTFGDFIADLAFQVLAGEHEVDRAKLALDGLKWTAARLAPRQYGDKQQVSVQHSVSDEAAAVLMALSQRAKDRQLEDQRTKIIDVTPDND
jgi:hypothetical protein